MHCRCESSRAALCNITLTSVLTICRFVDSTHGTSKRAAQAAAISILLSPGLLIIDHIHFQYNGCMYGLLVASLVLAKKQSGLLFSGLIFAVLLCMKHIYAYMAPAYFVFLLRAYCLNPRSIFGMPQWLNGIKLGGGIAAILVAAFGPFALKNQIPQLLSRLFPFQRGLCHAYWAPNAWAMYSFTDRILIYRTCLPIEDFVQLMLTASNSRPPSRPPRKDGGTEQRHSRLDRRHNLRSSARDFCHCVHRSHRSHHVSVPGEALHQGNLGQLYRRCDSVRLLVLLVRLSRPREGHSSGHHTLQPDRAQGPTVLWRISTSGGGRTRVSVSTALHAGRVPHQDHLHDFLVDTLPHDL